MPTIQRINISMTNDKVELLEVARNLFEKRINKRLSWAEVVEEALHKSIELEMTLQAATLQPK